HGLAFHQLETNQWQRASFAEANRTGATTGQEAQSPRLANHPHSLLQRALSRCSTSDGKLWSAHSRRGWTKVRHAAREGAGRYRTLHRRVQTAAAQARLHSKTEWKTAFARNPDDAGSRVAGAAFAGPRTRCGNDR